MPQTPPSGLVHGVSDGATAQSSAPLRWQWWAFGAVVILLGSVGAVVWHTVVTLPSYTVSADQGAVITEGGLSQVFATDVAYIFIGLIFGLLIGTVAWLTLNQIGWPVAFVAVLGGAIAALLCWQIGAALGPSDFVVRIAEVSAADTGAKVSIDFDLHTKVAVLVWPFAAALPVLLYSAFGPLETRPQRPAVVADAPTDD